jgi:DNA-binding NtrC family response regulator
MKVLILEQEKTIRQSLKNLIETYRCFEVFTAQSGNEGRSLFSTIRFDVILCGHQLPDDNGLELLKEFLRQNPKLISILMTAHNDDKSRHEAEKAGIRAYLEKPFDLQDLEEAMRIAECGMRNEKID